jgi:alkylated DNA repair dioxygenase AlkB
MQKVSKACNGAPFNAVLVRLYFDGNDNITWHTDGRTFLGSQPVIASLSLGAKAKFQMRYMTTTPCVSFKLAFLYLLPPLTYKLLLVSLGKCEMCGQHVEW